MYRELVLEETVRPARPSERFHRCSWRAPWPEVGSSSATAIRFLPCRPGSPSWPNTSPHRDGLPLDHAQIAAACAECCVGKRSLAELGRLSLIDVLLTRATKQQRELLLRETPERIMLPDGRKVPVHYEPGRPPWISSFLQDFFGMRSTPTLCAGRAPLTVHLLAPNRRPVQVTQDLPGFWERHYPALRRQLMRRYPKHAWP